MQYGSWRTPQSFTRYSTMTTHCQQQGQLKCFTVSVSEVKHTSLLPSAGDIDFHSASVHSLSLSRSPFSFLSLPPSPSPPFSLPPPFHVSRCVCLPSNSQRLKQPGLLREVNCTQIMFDRKRSAGATEERQRDRGEIEGRREGWMSE